MYVKRIVLRKIEDIAGIIGATPEERPLENRTLFTRAELEYCGNRPRCLGARFIIKECIFDYLQPETGYFERNYQEIEIVKNEFKKPMIRLYDGLSACAKRLTIQDILVSISHSKKWIAVMVLFCCQTQSGAINSLCEEHES